jgi:hypothetical protein
VKALRHLEPDHIRVRATRVRINGLPGWQAQAIIWSSISLLLSGAAWQIALLRRGPQGMPGAFDPWLARWHGLSAMAALFAFGIVASRHIGRGWSLKQRMRTGVSVTVLFVVLALTGFALAYLVPEEWHPPVGWMHSALGVAAFALGAVHRR